MASLTMSSSRMDCLDNIGWRLDDDRSVTGSPKVFCFTFEQQPTAKTTTPDHASHDLWVRCRRNIDIAPELRARIYDLLLKFGNHCGGALSRHMIVFGLQTLHQILLTDHRDQLG